MNTGTRTIRPNSAWRNPWVLAAYAMLLLVVSVNVSFIIVADRSNPGLVTEEYIKYGLQQNELGIQYREQKMRGWQVDMVLPKTMYQARKYRLVVQAIDKDGDPITGARAEIEGYRPSDAKQDIFFELIERPDQPGVYMTSELSLPLPGFWDVNLLLEQQDGQSYISSKRIDVQAVDKNAPERWTILKRVVNFFTPDQD